MANAKKKDAPKLKEWKRSNPGVKRIVVFVTNSGKYAATHHFDSIAKSLFALDIVCRSRAKSDKSQAFDFEEAIAAVEKEMTIFGETISSKIEQIQSLLKDRNIEQLVEYENPWSREFLIKTPQSFTALGMFSDFDKLCVLLDTAYLYGLTGKVTVDELSFNLANQFKALARSLYVRSDTALRQIKESREASVAAGDIDPTNQLVLAEVADFESNTEDRPTLDEDELQQAENSSGSHKVAAESPAETVENVS